MKNQLKLLLLLFISSIAIQGQSQHLHKHYEDLPCVNKNFNTLVHIPVDSATRQPIVGSAFIEKLLEETTKYFEPICMSFTNCEVNIMEDNYTYSSLRNSPIPVRNQMIKMNNLFSKDKRINIFITNHIDGYECGDSKQNGIETKDQANIFIALNNCPDSTSINLAHQIGHLFGLYDTHELSFGPERVDGTACETTGDLICDTPADPVRYRTMLDSMVVDCEFISPSLDLQGNYYEPQVGNIMSLYECKCGFSREQYIRMVETYENSPFKQY